MSDAVDRGVSLAELLCAFSFVSDMGMGQPLEHGLKTAYIGLTIAGYLGLPPQDHEAVFYGALLKDAGCTACGTIFATFFAGDDLAPRSDGLLMRPDSMKDAVAWFWRHAPSEPTLPTRIGRLFSFLAECRGVMKEGVTTHCEVGEMFARRLSLPEHVQRTVRFCFERWDGKGIAYGMVGADTPLAARLLRLCQVVEAAHAFGGAEAARAVAVERRGTDFDPELAAAFLEVSQQPDFWQIPDCESVQKELLEMRPACDFDRLDAAQVDNVCEVIADFADVKSRHTWNHSLQVAEVAVSIGQRMGLPAPDLARLKRAGLVHDLGKAAVPVGILDKGETLSEGEWERFRLHPYYTERALARVGPLRELADDAGAHHEAINGGGYHRKLRAQQIPLGGRILAVADRFIMLLRAEGEPERALRAMQPLVGAQLDGACYEGLLAGQGRSREPQPRRPRNPSDLTERELEVLRLACTGLTNREIAGRLVLSGKTVEHHFEHIYNKLGVTSRTAASVFAVQNGLAS